MGRGLTASPTSAGPRDCPLTGTIRGRSWEYTLIDRTPPVVAAKSPAAGATLTNLTAITVTFSEPVAGVNASDLLVNGTPGV